MATKTNWMSAMDDTKELRHLVMPGSHDAGMYESGPGVSAAGTNDTLTQFASIRGQLDLGTRFFDIRVYKAKDKLRIGHFASKKKDGFLGEFGPAFEDVVRDVREFLEANTSEVVIIKFSLAKAAHDDALALIKREWRGLLYPQTAPRNLAMRPLGAAREGLRGRVLALFDDVVGPISDSLHLVDKDVPRIFSGVELTRCMMYLAGDAPQAHDIDTVIKAQLKKREDRGSPGQYLPHLVMFYLTITARWYDVFLPGRGFCVADNTAKEIGLTGVPQAVAGRAKFSGWQGGSAAAYKVFIDKITSGPRPNIYMYDFIHAEMNDYILSLNEGLALT